MTIKEPLFERCPHDKENPYVMISKQEKEIMSIYHGHSHSFDVGIAKELGLNSAIVFNHIVYWLKVNASKGTNIHDGKIWMYETQKEIADFLEYLTFEEVKKSIVKLLDSGILIKGNYNKNPFDKTAWYTVADQRILKIKKTLTKAPCGAIASAGGRYPESPTAPSIYNVQEEHIQEEQQQQHRPAAAFSDSSKKEEVAPLIYGCLLKIDIPEHDKIEITQTYAADIVQNAIGWATNPDNPPKKGMAPSIKFACKNKLCKPKSESEIINENRTHAKNIEKRFKPPSSISLDVLRNSTEIVFTTCQKQPIVINYSEPDFKIKIDNYINKFGFKEKK